MNYEDMSDFEINKRAGMYLGHSVSAEHECIKTGSCFLLANKAFERIEFNPCNNPSDAWPIIVENGISIDFWGDSWGADIQLDGEVAFEHLDKNPLLAAMICFLKMKDTEK